MEYLSSPKTQVLVPTEVVNVSLDGATGAGRGGLHNRVVHESIPAHRTLACQEERD